MKFYWLTIFSCVFFFLNTTVKLVKCFFVPQCCALGSGDKYGVPHCHSRLPLPWQTYIIYHGPLSCWAWLQLEIILHSVLKAATRSWHKKWKLFCILAPGTLFLRGSTGKQDSSEPYIKSSNWASNQTYSESDRLGLESKLCH